MKQIESCSPFLVLRPAGPGRRAAVPVLDRSGQALRRAGLQPPEPRPDARRPNPGPRRTFLAPRQSHPLFRHESVLCGQLSGPGRRPAHRQTHAPPGDQPGTAAPHRHEPGPRRVPGGQSSDARTVPYAKPDIRRTVANFVGRFQGGGDLHQPESAYRLRIPPRDRPGAAGSRRRPAAHSFEAAAHFLPPHGRIADPVRRAGD